MPDKRELTIFFAFLAVLAFQFARESAISLKNGILAGEKSAGKTDYFAGVRIIAKAAIVWDAKENKILFAKNERAQLPLASLTKIMTTLLSLEEGKGDISVSKEAVREEGDSGLLVGEHFKTGDLAKLTLVSSANDGARAMAIAFVAAKEAERTPLSFTEAMNARAKSMGLSQTYFMNETGLDLSSALPGGYGSAEDMAKLFYYAVIAHEDIFGATSERQISVSSAEKTHLVKNTNISVGRIPGIIASKTGFTKLAGGNLAVVASIGLNHPVVVVVLGSTEEDRFLDMDKLM